MEQQLKELYEDLEKQEELSKLRDKAFRKAHSVIVNWWLRLTNPDFKTPLNGVVVAEVKIAIEEWELKEKRRLKRLHLLNQAFLECYRLAREKGIEDIEWLLEYRELFIKKCVNYFAGRLGHHEVNPDHYVELNEAPIVVNISSSQRRKYKELLKIYISWLNQKPHVSDAEPL